MQFVKKTSSRKNLAGLLIKLSVALIIILGVIFLLNKIEFPAPKKEIEKIISNENLKVVK
jgi:flagellar biogenesis protein FliO